MGDLTSAGRVAPGAVRRWSADPLSLLVLVGLGGAGAAVLLLGPAADGGPAAWWVPALFGVLAAGLALSGST